MNFYRRYCLIGSTVVCFESRGCMANEHRLQYLGVVTATTKKKVFGGPINKYYDAVKIKIIKRGSDSRDYRDINFGFEYEIVDDPSFQKLSTGLYVIVK